jgi:hypothetical protein
VKTSSGDNDDDVMVDGFDDDGGDGYDDFLQKPIIIQLFDWR